jgi:pantoate--beta-alanine ligase
MNVFRLTTNARDWATEQTRAGRRIALVPTMGALHAGHIALVRRARSVADSVAASIFVNPTQFGPNEDLDRYPRTLEADLAALDAEKVDAVFVPSVEEMYPAGFCTYVVVEGPALELEGACRPGHFRGVATVVSKLLNIIPSDFAVFGMKDFQQLTVIRRMAKDLNWRTEILAEPTVREPDGLALSSRNRYLLPGERESALSLSRALKAVRTATAGGEESPEQLEAVGMEVLKSHPGVDVEYFTVRDPETLSAPGKDWNTLVCLVAARVGSTRLIDNSVFDRTGEEVVV